MQQCIRFGRARAELPLSPEAAGAELLNAREREIVVLLNFGLTNLTDVAKELGYANHSAISKKLAKIRNRLRRSSGQLSLGRGGGAGTIAFAVRPVMDFVIDPDDDSRPSRADAYYARVGRVVSHAALMEQWTLYLADTSTVRLSSRNTLASTAKRSSTFADATLIRSSVR